MAETTEVFSGKIDLQFENVEKAVAAVTDVGSSLATLKLRTTEAVSVLGQFESRLKTLATLKIDAKIDISTASITKSLQDALKTGPIQIPITIDLSKSMAQATKESADQWRQWADAARDEAQKLYDDMVGHSIIPDLVNEIGDYLNMIPDDAKESIRRTIYEFQKLESEALPDIFDPSKLGVSGEREQEIASRLSSIKDEIGKFVKSLPSTVEPVKASMESVSQSVKTSAESIKDSLTPIVPELSQASKEIINSMLGVTENVEEAVQSMTVSVRVTGKEMPSVLATIKNAFADLADGTRQTFGMVKSSASEFSDDIKNSLISIGQAIAATEFGKVSGQVLGVFGQIKTAAVDVKTSLASAFADVGIAIAPVATEIKDAFTGAAGPTVMAGVSKSLGLLQDGMVNTASAIQRAWDWKLVIGKNKEAIVSFEQVGMTVGEQVAKIEEDLSRLPNKSDAAVKALRASLAQAKSDLASNDPTRQLAGASNLQAVGQEAQSALRGAQENITDSLSRIREQTGLTGRSFTQVMTDIKTGISVGFGEGGSAILGLRVALGGLGQASNGMIGVFDKATKKLGEFSEEGLSKTGKATLNVLNQMNASAEGIERQTQKLKDLAKTFGVDPGVVNDLEQQQNRLIKAQKDVSVEFRKTGQVSEGTLERLRLETEQAATAAELMRAEYGDALPPQFVTELNRAVGQMAAFENEVRVLGVQSVKLQKEASGAAQSEKQMGHEANENIHFFSILSGLLGRFNIKNIFGGVAPEAQKTSKSIVEVTKSVNGLNATAKGLGKIKNVFLETFSGSFLGNVASNVLGGTITNAISAMASNIQFLPGMLIQLASDANESMSKFGTVFGETTNSASQKLDELASILGRNSYEVKAWASSFQDTFVPLGFARDEAAKMSESLTALAIDVSSFNNVSEDQAIADFQSALVGNGETLRKYGIILNDVTLDAELAKLGIAGGSDAASEQAKAMARLNIILAGTKDAQGDAFKTGDQFANQMRALTGSLKEAGTTIGLALMPALSPFIQMLNSLADFIMPRVIATLQTFSTSITDVLGPLFSQMSSLISAGDIEGAFNLAVESVANGLNSIITYMDSFLPNAANWAYAWGEQIVAGLVDWASSSLVSALSSIGDTISSFLEPGSPPEKGPLSKIDKWGSGVMDVFGESMADSNMGGYASKALAPVSGILGGVSVPGVPGQAQGDSRLIDAQNKVAQIQQRINQEKAKGNVVPKALYEELELAKKQLADVQGTGQAELKNADAAKKAANSKAASSRSASNAASDGIRKEKESVEDRYARELALIEQKKNAGIISEYEYAAERLKIEQKLYDGLSAEGKGVDAENLARISEYQTKVADLKYKSEIQAIDQKKTQGLIGEKEYATERLKIEEKYYDDLQKIGKEAAAENIDGIKKLQSTVDGFKGKSTGKSSLLNFEIPDLIGKLKEQAGNIGKVGVEIGKSVATNAIKSLGDNLKNIGSSLLEKIKGGFTSVRNWINTLPPEWFFPLNVLIGFFASPIVYGLFGWIDKLFYGILNIGKAFSFLGGILRIASGLVLSWGVAGIFVVGIIQNWDEVVKDFNEIFAVTAAVIAEAGDNFSVIFDAISSAGGGVIFENFAGAVSLLGQSFVQLFATVTKVFKKGLKIAVIEGVVLSVSAINKFIDKMGGAKEFGQLLGDVLLEVSEAFKKFSDYTSSASEALLRGDLKGVVFYLKSIPRELAKAFSGGKTAEFFEKISAALSDVGKKIMTYMPSFDNIVNFFKDLVVQMNALSPWLTVVTAGIAAFAAIGFLAPIIMSAVGAIGGLIAAFGTASAAGTTIGTIITGVIALIGGPMTLAIAAIAGLIALVAVAWVNNWGGIREITYSAIEGIKNAFNGFMESETFKSLSNLFFVIVDSVKTLWPELVILGAVIGVALAPVASFGAGLIAIPFLPIIVAINAVIAAFRSLGTLLPYLDQIFSGIITVITGLIQMLTGGFQVIHGLFTGLITGDFSGIQVGLDNLAAGIGNVVTGALQTLAAFGLGLLAFGNDFIVKFVDNILWLVEQVAIAFGATGFAASIESIRTSLLSGSEFITQWATDIYASVKTTIDQLAVIIPIAMSTLYDNVIGWFTSIYDEVIGHSIVPDMITGVINLFTNLGPNIWTALQAYLPTLLGNFLQMGTDLVGNLVSSIGSGAGGVASAIMGLFGGGQAQEGQQPGQAGPGQDQTTAAQTSLMNMQTATLGASTLITTTITNMGVNTITVMSTMVTSVTESFIAMYSTLVGEEGLIPSLGTKTIEWLTIMSGGAVSQIIQMADLMKQAMKSDDWANIGRDIVLGIRLGIDTNKHLVIEVLKSMVRTAISTTRTELGIASPSVVFRELGINTIEGFVFGMRSKIISAKTVMQDMADEIHDKLKSSTAGDKIALAIRTIKSVPEEIDKLSRSGKLNFENLRDLFRSNGVLGGAIGLNTSQYTDILDTIVKKWDQIREAQKKAFVTGRLEFLDKIKEFSNNVADKFKEKLTEVRKMAVLSRRDIENLAGKRVTPSQLEAMAGNLAAGQSYGAEMDLAIRKAAASQSDLNDAMAQQKSIQEEIIKQQQAQGKLDFVRQQFEVVKTIKEMNLNGNEILSGLSLGIDASVSDVMTAITRLTESMVREVQETLEINSPSRVFEKLGKFVPQGMAIGIAKGADSVVGSIGNIASSLAGSVNVTSPSVTPAMATSGQSVSVTNYFDNKISKDVDVGKLERKIIYTTTNAIKSRRR